MALKRYHSLEIKRALYLALSSLAGLVYIRSQTIAINCIAIELCSVNEKVQEFNHTETTAEMSMLLRSCDERRIIHEKIPASDFIVTRIVR